jgi:hypothetical protein
VPLAGANAVAQASLGQQLAVRVGALAKPQIPGTHSVSDAQYCDIVVDMVAPYPDPYLDSDALNIKRIFDMSRGMAARLFLKKKTRLI